MMSTITPVKKVIFDNDDVNIDSEHLAMTVMDDFSCEMVGKYVGGNALQKGHIYANYKGTSTDKIVQALIDNYDLPYDSIKTDYQLGDIPDEKVALAVAEIVTQQTIDAFKGNLKAIPNISVALKEIDKMLGGIENRALCTTSPHDRMVVSLESAVDPVTGENAGLAELFPDEENRRVSGYDYDNKYEYFLQLNPDWDPKETAVVEDSLSGVRKALTASQDFRVIGTVAASSYQDKREQIGKLLQAGARIVVTDVADLPRAVEWLNNGMNMNNVPQFTSAVHHNNPLQGDQRVFGPSPTTAIN